MKNELYQFMEEHSLTDEDVARILHVSLMTVRIWKCKSERNITKKDFALLKYIVRENEKNVLRK